MSYKTSQSYMLSNSDHYKVYRSHKVEKKNTATVINPYVRLNNNRTVVSTNKNNSKFYTIFLENRINSMENNNSYRINEKSIDNISNINTSDVPEEKSLYDNSTNYHVNEYINTVKSKKKQKKNVNHLENKNQFLLINRESNGRPPLPFI